MPGEGFCDLKGLRSEDPLEMIVLFVCLFFVCFRTMDLSIWIYVFQFQDDVSKTQKSFPDILFFSS